MSFVSKKQLEMGGEAFAAQCPDFQTPWVKKLLDDPEISWTAQVPRPFLGDTVSNAMFEKTLGVPDAIKAHLSFNRPSQEKDAAKGVEECWLLSIGPAIDGRTGRAHGGFNALVMDQISGSVSHHARPVPEPPATAYLNVNYKAPVSTPSVVLLRAWITEVSGRKVFITSVLEQDGTVCCTSKALFVYSKQQKL